jgi:hypothetical protein
VRPGRAADPSPPSSAAVMEEWSYTSTHPLGHTGPVTGSLLHNDYVVPKFTVLQLYLYPLSLPSWHVTGRPLPLHLLSALRLGQWVFKAKISEA